MAQIGWSCCRVNSSHHTQDISCLVWCCRVGTGTPSLDSSMLCSCEKRGICVTISSLFVPTCETTAFQRPAQPWMSRCLAQEPRWCHGRRRSEQSLLHTQSWSPPPRHWRIGSLGRTVSADQCLSRVEISLRQSYWKSKCKFEEKNRSLHSLPGERVVGFAASSL